MPSGEGGIQCTDKQNARINSGGGEYSIVKKEQNELGLGFGCGNDGAMVMVKGGEGEKDENARKRKKRRIEVAEDTRTVKMAKWEISNGKEFGEQVVSNCDLTVEMETDNSHYLGNVDISTGEVTVEMDTDNSEAAVDVEPDNGDVSNFFYFSLFFLFRNFNCKKMSKDMVQFFECLKNTH